MYGPPNGRAFIAVEGSEALGCGAYRRLDASSCEMKRFFVPVQYQGLGLGRKICRELVASARRDGYVSMKLDTGKIMREAIGLYRSFGFATCHPYYEYPDTLLPNLVFMELLLDAAADDSRSGEEKGGVP
jgi:ribosomal protein S18 acetylase RimI-like enzyme